jgi:hypothetical protein
VLAANAKRDAAFRLAWREPLTQIINLLCEGTVKRYILLPLLLALPVLTPAQQKPSAVKKTAQPSSITGTYKDVMNTLKVRELPEHKVLLDFAGYYPNVPSSQRRRYGADTYNVGSFQETVPLKNSEATVTLKFTHYPCAIQIKFLRDKLRVTQEGTSNDCGFGFNVEAGGLYKKVSSRAPEIH